MGGEERCQEPRVFLSYCILDTGVLYAVLVYCALYMLRYGTLVSVTRKHA